MGKNKKKIIIFILTIILVYNIYNRFFSDHYLYELMIENYNMKINKNNIFSKSKTYFDAPTIINGYLTKVVPKRKEYFNNGKFEVSIYYEYGNLQIIFVIEKILLTPYIFNELVYDKSKGNNFEIVDKYILSHIDNLEIDVTYTFKKFEKEKLVFLGLFSVYEFDGSKFNYIEDDKYRTLYSNCRTEMENYFLKNKEPVDIEKLDVFEYMQNHQIYPIIKFRYKGNLEEGKEILQEINKLFIENMNLEYIGVYIE